MNPDNLKQNRISAIILAGGKSSRMNEDKALIPISGVPLVQSVARQMETYFQEVIVSVHSLEPFRFLPYPLVPDKYPGQGPFMGILCGLEASSHDVNFVIACDIPEIDFEFIHYMQSFTDEYEIVVPVSGEDHYEPLFAFYNKSLLPRIEDLLFKQKKRKILEIFPIAKVKYIPFHGEGWYHNLNTESDLKLYLKEKERSFGK